MHFRISEPARGARRRREMLADFKIGKTVLHAYGTLNP